MQTSALIETTAKGVVILTEGEAAYLKSLADITKTPMIFCLTGEKLHEIVTDFYRYWHNAPGTNTDQGFEDWWKENKISYLKQKDIDDGNETW